jgi:uncharacterized protein YecA (UPF0149 family)
MPEPMPHTYAGDAVFSALLTEVQCPMPLHQVKTFVLGCLAAPGRAAGPGRNAPCPCGSRKKYKQCCGTH